MAVTDKKPFPSSIKYFDNEGRHNLDDVLKVVKWHLKRREELRTLKLVIFTAEGQGPALAYNQLREFKTKMIAVTFPPRFSVAKPDSKERYFPQIDEEIRCFFQGVKIEVLIPPRLPFDLIDDMDGHNQQVQLISKTIAMFGSGFALCIQAVLHACDMGLLQEGESVIAMSGDTAGLFVASSSAHFLSKNGLHVQEIFCKARRLTISRRQKPSLIEAKANVLEGETVTHKELP